MQIIRDAGFDELLALCGGNCSCATCHVYVDSGQIHLLGSMTELEDGLLDDLSHRKPTSRLSCQIIFAEPLDGLSLTIAPEG
ncbi:2Fe-2S iron-sulfur cluster-binding protein [Bradyrhizobium manausense]